MKRAFTLFLLFLLLSSLLLTACTPPPAEEKHTPFLYFSADLTPYLSLASALYASEPIPYEPPADDLLPTVKEAIDAITAMHNKVTITDKPIQKGDVISFYYRLVKNGATVSDGTNYLGDPEEYTVGSGEFIPGFDELVLGLIPEDTELSFYTDSDRLIKEDDVLYVDLTYSTDYGSGSIEEVQSNVRLELADPSLQQGFRDVLIGKTAGKTFGFSFKEDRNGDGVAEGIDCAVTVLRIAKETEFHGKITMPKDHGALAGETLDLYLVVESLKRNVPLEAVDSTFLAKYYPSLKVEEGEDPNEVFAAYIEGELAVYREATLLEAKKAAIHRYLDEHAEFFAYPKGEVAYLSSLMEATFLEAFNVNNSLAVKEEPGYYLYPSLEEYAVYYFGIENGEEYRETITKNAAELVRRSLITGAVITGEGLDIAEEALNAKKTPYFQSLSRLNQARSALSGTEMVPSTAKELEELYINVNGSEALEELLIYEVFYDFFFQHATFVAE